MTKAAYYAFLHSDRHLNDIKKFCYCNGISYSLAVGTTFNLYDFGCQIRRTATDA